MAEGNKSWFFGAVMRITVRNVKTKQGEGRYCVLFEQNGQRSKFITNCYNLKDVLDQAREAENNGQKIFPVENVIVKRRSLGDGKSAYYFEE